MKVVVPGRGGRPRYSPLMQASSPRRTQTQDCSVQVKRLENPFIITKPVVNPLDGCWRGLRKYDALLGVFSAVLLCVQSLPVHRSIHCSLSE